jgi:hypothetical protein
MVVKGDRLAVRRIDFVIDRDGSLLVRRGLEATDDVVAAPWAEAKDGDRVAVEIAEAHAEARAPQRGEP